MIERTQAIDQYEQLTQGTPRWYMDAIELNEVVEYYEDHGMQADAEQCLRQAIALHPNDEELLVKQAYILRSKGNITQAERIISRLDQSNSNVIFFKAEEALARFDVEEAKKLFKQLLDNDSTTSPDWHLRIEIAECYLSEGYMVDARNLLLQVPSTAKEAKKAHVLMSECYYSVHDIPNAIAELNKALDLDPYDVNNWSMMAELHYESQHYAESQEACQYALAIKNDDEKALRISFFAYSVTQQIEKALQQAAIYVQHWPGEYYLPMVAGELCATEGRMQDALAYLGRANRNCPDQHQDRLRIISIVAQLQAHQGFLEESFRTLQCACTCGSQYSMVCVQMAGLAADVNKMDFAAARLNEVLPEIKTCNTELCAAVIELMRSHQLLFMLCPEITNELKKISTNIL